MAQPMSVRMRRIFQPRKSTPVVTYSLIIACVLIYGLQWITGQALTNAWFYAPPLTASQPWRMITSIFLHSPTNPLHLVLNMYSLYVLGPTIETLLGRVRFLVLYLVSGFAGSVAVLLLAPESAVLGASGAIFGLMGAYFLITRHLGRGQTQIFIVIALNLAIGFFISGIAWQAHIGGLAGGLAVSAVYLATRRTAQRPLQILGVVGIVVALLLLTLLGVSLMSR
jgi:membrane associated rhomboid family serine protease